MAVSQSLTLTQQSQSINENSSVVKLLWTSTQSGNSYNGYKKTAYYYVSINGGAEQKYSVTYTLPKSTTKTIADVELTIPHNEDGTCSIFVWTWMDTGISAGVVEKDARLVLDTIPRCSTLTVGDGTLGSTMTMTVTQKAASFTHKITASCGYETYTPIPRTRECSVSWTPPEHWARFAPNDNSVPITLRIYTYNRETEIGYKDYTISCAIPYVDSLNPSLVTTITDANGYDKLLGGWVQGHSKVQLDIETYGVYGASITKVEATFDGATYKSESVQDGTVSFSTNTILGYGVLPIDIIVTDSRGRTREGKLEIFVQKYSYPKITLFTARRCTLDDNQNPVLNPLGDHILVSFGAEITSLNNNNAATYYIGYKKVSETTHMAVEQTNLKGQYSVNSTYVVPADPAYSYTIIFTAIDTFRPNGTRLTLDVPPAKQVLSLMKKNGEIVGMAINKVAEHEGYFDIGMPVLFSGEGDIVVEQGEKDGWTYRKWQSGVAECWKTVAHTTKVNTPWGNLYVGTTPVPRQNYPIVFAAKPVENVSLTSSGSMGMIYPEQSGYGVNGAYATAMYNICCLGSVTTDATYYVSYTIKGKWK